MAALPPVPQITLKTFQPTILMLAEANMGAAQALISTFTYLLAKDPSGKSAFAFSDKCLEKKLIGPDLFQTFRVCTGGKSVVEYTDANCLKFYESVIHAEKIKQDAKAQESAASAATAGKKDLA